MGYKNFDQHKQGEYLKSYFKNDKNFYAGIMEHISKAIPQENTVGIDIGAGPGIEVCPFLNLT